MKSERKSQSGTVSVGEDISYAKTNSTVFPTKQKPFPYYLSNRKLKNPDVLPVIFNRIQFCSGSDFDK